MFRRPRQPLLLLLFSALLFGFGTTGAECAENLRLTVLISQAHPSFQETLAGFRETLEQSERSVEWDILRFGGEMERSSSLVETLLENPPQLIFTLGSLALEAVGENLPDTPLIAGLVLRREDIPEGPKQSGVYLDFPVEVELGFLQRLLPAAATVGVLFNPDDNKERIDRARKEARRLGLDLVAEPVSSPRQLPAALRSLEPKIDVLWGISDKTVLAPETAKNILLFSFRNRIPFVGLSEAWVKAGALYALDRDYRDLGRQCGEMALDLLPGGQGHPPPPAPPRRIRYILNLDIAERMKIEFPRSVIEAADKTF